MFRTLLASVAIAALTASQVAFAEAPSGTTGEATIIDLNGDNIGSGILQKTPSGIVLVTLSVTGLPQGWKGVHIHETGKCDPGEGFKTAGGHLAGNKSHGVMSENGPHPGDLPNQMVQAGGRLVAEIYAPPSLNMSSEGEAPVFDEDGSAFIIHSDRDDYTSQPAGNAGERIACGVIELRE